MRHPPLNPSHQALPMPHKMVITAQPVAALYVLHIYLSTSLLFVCVEKLPNLALDEPPQYPPQVYFLPPSFFSFCFSLSLFLHLKVAGSPFTHSVFQVGPVALKAEFSG